MKLTELRPCDKCAGPVAKGFYAIDVSFAMVSPQAANQVLGLAQMLGGVGGLGLAEVFAPTADEAVVIFGDKDASLRTRLIVCQACVLDGPIDVAILKEQRDQATKNAEPQEGSPR